MPRRSEQDLARVCIRLFNEDYKYLQEVAIATDGNTNNLIRSIIHSYVVQIKDRERQKLDKIPGLNPGYISGIIKVEQ